MQDRKTNKWPGLALGAGTGAMVGCYLQANLFRWGYLWFPFDCIAASLVIFATLGATLGDRFYLFMKEYWRWNV